MLRRTFTDITMMALIILVFGFQLWMTFGNGGLIDIYQVSGGRYIPDLFLFQNSDTLSSLLHEYGPQGRLFYLKYQFRDFLYPFIYGLFLMGVLLRLIKPKTFNIWVFIPWLAVLADLTENYFLRIIFYDFPQLVSDRVQIASVATSLKWFFLLFSMVLIVIAFVSRRRKYEKKKKKTEVNI
jgi:hypothetical protein